MEYSERDVEDLICSEGIKGFTILGRQVKTEYGIIDLLGYNEINKYIIVLELKKGIVDESAVGQIMRYLAAVKELMKVWKNNPEIYPGLQDLKEQPMGLLVGIDCNDAVRCIVKNFNFLNFMNYRIHTTITTNLETYERADGSLQRDIDYFNKYILNELTTLIDMQQDVKQEGGRGRWRYTDRFTLVIGRIHLSWNLPQRKNTSTST